MTIETPNERNHRLLEKRFGNENNNETGIRNVIIDGIPIENENITGIEITFENEYKNGNETLITIENEIIETNGNEKRNEKRIENAIKKVKKLQTLL